MYFHYPTLKQVIRESYFSKNAHPIHAAYVTLFISLYFPARTLVSLGQLIDKVAYRNYKNQAINSPILITGNPRSGTTFLHRLLADDPQFTSTKLYHTIFPAVSFYRFFDTLEKLSQRFDKTLNRYLEWLDKKSFGGWQGIHKTELNGYEEDETIFVWTLLTPVIGLLFPYPHQLKSATWVDNLPSTTRQQLMKTYLDCLKRHIYATGKNKTLLIKNTTLTGRLESMIEALPDMRIIHLVRHPYQAIASFLSMYDVPWRTFAPQTRNNDTAFAALAQLYANYYRKRIQIFQAMKQSNPDNFIEIRYDNLTNDPWGTVETIYQKFGLEMGQEFQHQLRQTLEINSRYQSRHNYSLEQFGLSQERLYKMMPDVFEFYEFEP